MRKSLKILGKGLYPFRRIVRGIGESNVYSRVKSCKCQASNYISDIASSLEPVFEKRSISPNHLLVAYCMSSRVNAFSLQYLANSEHGKGNIERFLFA